MKHIRNKYNLPPRDKEISHEKLIVDTYNASKGDLDKDDGYNCEICNNKGHLMYLNGRYEETRECKCMKMRRLIRNMQKSGLQNLIKECTLSKYIAQDDWQKNIKHQAIKYCNEELPKWWFIGGTSGSGKTHICTAICRELLLKGHEVKYMLWKQDSTLLKGCVNEHDMYKKKMDRLKQIEVLYIDDFLKPVKGQDSQPTAADINLAFELIDARKSANLRTIISSERSIEELLNIDTATASRIVSKATSEFLIGVGGGRKKNYRLKDMDGILYASE